MEQLHVHDTITGARLQQVHPEGGSYTARINGSDESLFRFRLRDSLTCLPRDMNRDYFRANARMLVLSDGDHVKSATVNLTPVYTDEAGILTVAGRGIREFANQRMTFGVANYSDGDLPIVTRSHSGAVRALVLRMMQWGGGWPLPIDPPSDSSGPYTRLVKRWEAAFINDLLIEIEAEGYEVYFRPYLMPDGAVRFQTRVAAPVTIGSALHLPVSVPESRVKNLQVTEDGSKQLSGSFVIGEGTELDTVTGWAGFMGGESIPVRDAAIQKKSIANVDALNRIATAELAARRNAIKQWSFDIVDDGLPVGSVTPGALLDLDVLNNPWVNDGVYRQRVIAVAGLFGEKTLKPEVQLYGA